MYDGLKVNDQGLMPYLRILFEGFMMVMYWQRKLSVLFRNSRVNNIG